MNQDLLLSITLKKFWKFCIFVISNNQSFISQILRVVGALGEEFDFSFSWHLTLKVILIWKLQKSSSTQSEL